MSQGDSKKRNHSKKKFKVVEKIEQHHIDKLSAAFDDLAKKEGFSSPSDTYFADDKTFEDEFEDDEGFVDDDEEEEEIDDELLDSLSFDLADFEEGAEEDETDGFLSTRGGDVDDMDARIAAAQFDASSGRVSVPSELDDFARDITAADLKQLGFRPELNPFGNDETPRRERFQLVTDAMVCPACGSDFQSQNETKPGYLPPEKFETQVKLSKIEEMQKLKEKAETSDWTTEDEVEWLLQTSGTGSDENVDDIDIDALAEELGLDMLALSEKKTICKRCHGLQNFGKVDESLRPGWTDEPLLSQEKFRNLLRPIREKPAVIIALVDLFDFSGSVLPELDKIAGDNPVILAANKADLLPSQMGRVRVENWVRRELEYLGVKSLANVGGAVRLVSCKTGIGVSSMLAKARSLADEMDCDIYVVGAANAGKSTLLNQILSKASEDKPDRKVRAGNRNALKGAVTTSPLPGTTLKFIKVDLGGGRNLYDTPGLLVPGTLTQLLTPDELKIVVPKK